MGEKECGALDIEDEAITQAKNLARMPFIARNGVALMPDIHAGKGNLQSYCSCSHGAGRAMSRFEARRRFSLTDLVAQTEGVECRKDAAVIDEIPAAYKDIDKVMENQKDLVEVLHTLKQVMCVKGA